MIVLYNFVTIYFGVVGNFQNCILLVKWQGSCKSNNLFPISRFIHLWSPSENTSCISHYHEIRYLKGIWFLYSITRFSDAFITETIPEEIATSRGKTLTLKVIIGQKKISY